MSRRGADEGQATVELALVLPLLVAMVLLVIQVAMVASERIQLDHVARVAARAAVEDPSPSAVARAAEAASDLDARRLSVSVRGGSEPGDAVSVRVRYTAVTDVALVGRLLPDVTFDERLEAQVG
jgi:Flp pilus assembly protein TadG